MGGAMDLIVGTKYVIDELNHRDKKENSKILKKCTLHLSAQKYMDIIIDEISKCSRDF